ncbi:hypothetical protein PN36_31345 [Candidatus Thiomargarita nelsonii]|uniref:Uncharacterized protein n=1 Tax=Candidatus Thiomargarita nelsonii TaxID=1003181 RepID=A0A0A6P3A9_9GAMM|nr:hypothetical protein PN36_31345 [Candidatus Thiomargarita nelsonii]
MISLKTFRHDTVGDGVFKDGFGKYGVLTYDVGVWRTDMSLFLREIENVANMRVTELGTDGTGRGDACFFGNGFSRLLFKRMPKSIKSLKQIKDKKYGERFLTDSRPSRHSFAEQRNEKTTI